MLTGCHQSARQRDARAGVIEENAPVKTKCQIVIAAPASKLWKILVDVKDWPQWQADIVEVSVKTRIGEGASFDWSTGSGVIHSRIALFDPDKRLGWTGRLLIFHAIHIWILQPLPNGQTLVRIQESMTGWPIAWLFSSAELGDADQRWLEFLRKKAERP